MTPPPTPDKPLYVQWIEEKTGVVLERPAGLPVPDPTVRHLSLRLPVALFEDLEALAKSTSMTVSAYVRQLIQGAVDPHATPRRADIDKAIETLHALRRSLPRSAS